VRRLAADEVAARAAELGLIYAEAYRDPPYNEDEQGIAEFVEHLPRQPRHPGFAMAVQEAPDGHLIAFAFGFTFEPGVWWRQATGEPELLQGVSKFAVMELAVRPAWHRRGIATALMTDLLSGRPEPYATLCANPRAQARAIYSGWAWQPAGTAIRPGGPSDILIKRIDAPQ
jgi:GNAT superfamily N-acetyltransferase